MKERMLYFNPEALIWFTHIMMKKLIKNDKKYSEGWKKSPDLWLFHRLQQETIEMTTAFKEGDWENLIEEAADVANIAMMIADNTRDKIEGVENDSQQNKDEYY